MGHVISVLLTNPVVVRHEFGAPFSLKVMQTYNLSLFTF